MCARLTQDLQNQGILRYNHRLNTINYLMEFSGIMSTGSGIPNRVTHIYCDIDLIHKHSPWIDYKKFNFSGSITILWPLDFAYIYCPFGLIGEGHSQL